MRLWVDFVNSVMSEGFLSRWLTVSPNRIVHLPTLSIHCVKSLQVEACRIKLDLIQSVCYCILRHCIEIYYLFSSNCPLATTHLLQLYPKIPSSSHVAADVRSSKVFVDRVMLWREWRRNQRVEDRGLYCRRVLTVPCSFNRTQSRVS